MVESYLTQNHSRSEQRLVRTQIREMGIDIPESLKLMGTSLKPVGTSPKPTGRPVSYEELQDRLSRLNEKESDRKDKGVYYTPQDIVRFILGNSVKMACGKLRPDTICDLDGQEIPYRRFCLNTTIYDPTCGTGVFLLAALEMKFDLLDRRVAKVSRATVHRIVATIYGNDLNADSIAITGLRILLCVLHRYGASKVRGLAACLAGNFTVRDFVAKRPENGAGYDVIVGNPPYVEDSKSDSAPERRYGNIYANVLENAALCLRPGGVMGFIVPLSYIATPRMRAIRDELFGRVPEQYILSFSDRPDCLFSSVHQKLCVLLGRNRGKSVRIFTGNYRYWYCEERPELFRSLEVVRNRFKTDQCIPKLGNQTDVDIYRKLLSHRAALTDRMGQGSGPALYLNMRATFWIKAFGREHTGGEYRVFRCENEQYRNLCVCLLNSSLFWWYWICVSDCWHITGKELGGFRIPEITDFEETDRLAAALEDRLEATKKYVGTTQTEYEYKHKDCVKEIHRVDDYINGLYGLSAEESLYIQNFAYRYRISGGADHGRD